MKLVFREEIRKFKITESVSPYEEMVKFVESQFVVSTNILNDMIYKQVKQVC